MREIDSKMRKTYFKQWNWIVFLIFWQRIFQKMHLKWDFEPNFRTDRSRKVVMKQKSLITQDAIHLWKTEKQYSSPNHFNNHIYQFNAFLLKNEFMNLYVYSSFYFYRFFFYVAVKFINWLKNKKIQIFWKMYVMRKFEIRYNIQFWNSF